jgi:hypothetical protein
MTKAASWRKIKYWISAQASRNNEMTYSRNDIQQHSQTPILHTSKFIHLFFCQIVESGIAPNNSRKRDIRYFLRFLRHARIDRTPSSDRVCAGHRHCSRDFHGCFGKEAVDSHSYKLKGGGEPSKPRHSGIGSLRDGGTQRVCSWEGSGCCSGLGTGDYLSATFGMRMGSVLS